MQFFVLVLNREECLEPILEGMLAEGLSGGTILNSTGMMRVLDGDNNVDLPMMGILRHFYRTAKQQASDELDKESSFSPHLCLILVWCWGLDPGLCR